MIFAQYVRLKVKQKVPVPNLYQRLTIQLTRGIDTTITVSESSTGPLGGIFGGNSSSSNTTITQTRMSRLVKLTYAQTVKSHFNNLGAAEFAGETGGTSSNVTQQVQARVRAVSAVWIAGGVLQKIGWKSTITK